jgi:hypothetical protein
MMEGKSWRTARMRCRAGSRPATASRQGTGATSASNKDHVGVFGEEEHGKRHSRILDVKPTISDSPSAMSKGARLVSATMRSCRPRTSAAAAASSTTGSRVPVGKTPCPCPHDVAEVQAIRHHQHDDQGKAHRHFVGNHLCGGAHAAKEGVLRVRSPASKDDAIHADRRDRHDVKQAGIDSPATTSVSLNGITAQAASAGAKANIGAIRKTTCRRRKVRPP